MSEIHQCRFCDAKTCICEINHILEQVRYSLNNIPKGPALLLRAGAPSIAEIGRGKDHGNYNHAAILLPDGQIIDSCIGHGVRIRRINKWEGVDMFSVNQMSREQWLAAIFFAISKVGSGYDYWHGLGLPPVGSSKQNRWTGSNLVYSALSYAGIRLLNCQDPRYLSAEHLAWSPLLRPIRLDIEEQ